MESTEEDKRHNRSIGLMAHLPTARAFRACDTGVYFLQTAEAAARWPCGEERLAELRAAFEASNAPR